MLKDKNNKKIATHEEWLVAMHSACVFEERERLEELLKDKAYGAFRWKEKASLQGWKQVIANYAKRISGGRRRDQEALDEAMVLVYRTMSGGWAEGFKILMDYIEKNLEAGEGVKSVRAQGWLFIKDWELSGIGIGKEKIIRDWIQRESQWGKVSKEEQKIKREGLEHLGVLGIVSGRREVWGEVLSKMNENDPKKMVAIWKGWMVWISLDRGRAREDWQEARQWWERKIQEDTQGDQNWKGAWNEMLDFIKSNPKCFVVREWANCEYEKIQWEEELERAVKVKDGEVQRMTKRL